MNNNNHYKLALDSFKKSENFDFAPKLNFTKSGANTTKNNYEEFGFNDDFDVQQIYQFLDNAPSSKKVNVNKRDETEVQTFWKKISSQDSYKPSQLQQNNKEEENKQNDSSNDDSFDEDMITEQIRCCENEEEMKQFIEINELRCSIINPNYKKLYLKLKKKAILLMKVIKSSMEKEESSSQIDQEQQKKQLSDELERYKTMYQNLSQKLTNLNRKNTNMEYKYEQLQEKLEKMENEYNILKEAEVMNIDLQEIIALEKKTKDNLELISKKKNEMIDQLSKKIKAQNDSHKSMCIICQEKPIDCLLQPCNHACCCYSCAAGLESCPMDRQLFTNIKRIYLS